MNTTDLLKMDLQTFSEPNAEPGQEPSTGGEGEKGLDLEALTPEQLQAIKEAQGWKSNEEIDGIVKSKKKALELKAAKEKEEAEKLAKMNADERAQHEREQLEAELNQLKKEKAVIEMQKEARNMLSEKEINVDDTTLSYFVSDDAEATKQGVTALTAFVEGLRKQWDKERNTGRTPRVLSGQEEIDPFKEVLKKY